MRFASCCLDFPIQSLRAKHSATVLSLPTTRRLITWTNGTPENVGRVVLSHLVSSLHQVNHAIELVYRTKLSCGAIEPKYPPCSAVKLSATQCYDLHHTRSGMLIAKSWYSSFITPARNVGTPRVCALHALEHIDRIRWIRLTPVCIIHHLTRAPRPLLPRSNRSPFKSLPLVLPPAGPSKVPAKTERTNGDTQLHTTSGQSRRFAYDGSKFPTSKLVPEPPLPLSSSQALHRGPSSSRPQVGIDVCAWFVFRIHFPEKNLEL